MKKPMTLEKILFLAAVTAAFLLVAGSAGGWIVQLIHLW